MKAFKITILLFTITLLFSQCKFYSFTGASISPNIKTYTVNPFDDLALINPNYSQLLTQALIDKLATETNLTAVKSDGDVEFSGEIVAYRVKSVASSGGDVAAQEELRIQIKVSYKNYVEDDLDWSKNFTQFANFDKDVNFNDVEDALVEEINEILVIEVFSEAFVNW